MQEMTRAHSHPGLRQVHARLCWHRNQMRHPASQSQSDNRRRGTEAEALARPTGAAALRRPAAAPSSTPRLAGHFTLSPRAAPRVGGHTVSQYQRTTPRDRRRPDAPLRAGERCERERRVRDGPGIRQPGARRTQSPLLRRGRCSAAELPGAAPGVARTQGSI